MQAESPPIIPEEGASTTANLGEDFSSFPPNLCHIALLAIVADKVAAKQHSDLFPEDTKGRHIAQEVLSTVPTVLDIGVDGDAEAALQFPYGLCQPLPVAVIRKKWKTYA